MSKSDSTRSDAPESETGSSGRPGAPSAVGYVRLSQESDRSIAAQKEEIRDFCEEVGLNLVRIYDDGERASGFDDADRPAYREMLVAVEEQEIDAVVARDRDRLSRDKDERAAFLTEMDRLGVDVYAAGPGERVGTDDEAWLVERVRAWTDDVQKQKEIERARREVERRLAEGYYQGRPPFGFQFDDEGKYLVPDPEEFDRAREVLDRREQGESYRQIGEAVGISKDAVAGVLDRREKYESFADGARGHPTPDGRDERDE